MNSIFTRRSIRKYTPDKINKEMQDKILKAGMCAPSAGNQRPWQFIVIEQKDTLSQLSQTHPYAGMLNDAPLAIVVCGDDSLEIQHHGYWVQDCSAATQNILLMIDALKLGAVWLGVEPKKDRIDYIRNLFNLPDHIHPFAILSIGHPAETKSANDRFEPEKIHREKW